MTTKYAIITGGSSGLGLHFAKSLYACGGFSVILGCRNKEKAERAISEFEYVQIDEQRKSLFRDVKYLQLELTSLESIEKFVDEFADICGANKLYLLVNNAGIMNHPYALTSSGLEIHFVSNFLGHFYLTNLLLEKDLFADKSRILNITSSYYTKCPFIPDDEVLMSPTPMDNRPSNYYYSASKLANCLHVLALNEKFRRENKQIKIVAVRPGFVRGTEGIAGTIHCAMCDFDELESGSLYYDTKPIEYDKFSVTNDAADELWNTANRLIAYSKNNP